eukprot:GGOE01036218.1.p2 GENE.GGOE01036218.1~~GGOE01036218.1.p2  ORF type:complete len:185 (-),score=57.16 GGOE01036218.1:180-698(-)
MAAAAELLKYCGLILLTAFLLDMPLARVHYWARVTYTISPVKLQQLQWLEESKGHCNVTVAMAKGTFANCSNFCGVVKGLVEKRQEILHAVRDNHPLGGGPGGFMFDLGRGRIRQSTKVEKLLERPCERLLKSVDDIGDVATYTCVGALVLGAGLIGWLAACLPSALREKTE